MNPRTEGACVGMDPAIFFEASREAEAKDVCKTCQALAECLELGLTERFGMWGGLNQSDLNRARKARGLPMLSVRVPLPTAERRAQAREKAAAEVAADPNDPRHGTINGYAAGCREPCCKEAKRVKSMLERARRQEKVA